MKTAFFFGGSGYIGSFLIEHFINENRFHHYYIFDLQPPKYLTKTHSNITFIQGDVRNPISFPIENSIDPKNSWIFNLAAIHREPGHENHEYFNTNINGAKNINIFADKINVKNIYFTSSIAPYGKSLLECTESSPLYPETPYGISKSLAEQIHQTWLENNADKRLIIVRPSVIYGPSDPGNILRTIKALKKGMFMLPNSGAIIKSYGYIFGLIESASFVIDQNKRLVIYNYAENPIENLKNMTIIIKTKFNYTKPTFNISLKFLVIIAGIIQSILKLIGKKSDIHPTRVRKAAFPTNIKPQYLIDNDFKFNYGLAKSLDHWYKISPQDF